MPNDDNLVPHAPPGFTLPHQIAMVTDAPPMYGHHQLDRFFSDVDTSGYVTPAVMSGATTPLHPASRSHSSDNLAGLTPMTPVISGVQEIPPEALQRRLSNLPETPPSRGQRNRSSNYSGGSETIGSPSPSSGGGGPSDGDHSSEVMEGHVAPTQTPATTFVRTPYRESCMSGDVEHIEYDVEELSRVPSYDTARGTPLRSTSYDQHGLPSYHAATSRPPSPTPQPQQSSRHGPQRLPQAHVHASNRESFSTSNNTSPNSVASNGRRL